MTVPFDTIQASRDQSVQGRAQLGQLEDLISAAMWLFQRQDSSIINAPYGTPQYDYNLLRFVQLEGNEILQGVISMLAQRVGSLDWQVTGKRGVARFQDLIQFAELGEGWQVFVERFIQSFTATNMGAVIELTGPGDPNGPMAGPVTGFATLDPSYCWPSGNLEYPVYYNDPHNGQWHRMHWTRVYWVNDMRSVRARDRGYGFCAVNRTLAASYFMTNLSRYKRERIDDLPPAGILAFTNVTQKQFNDAREDFSFDLRAAGQDFWKGLLTLFGVDPEHKVEVDLTEFSKLPDWFNQNDEYETYVRLVAHTWGVDMQDLWTLSGSRLGTGTQSEVLHTKARGKMLAKLIKALERFIAQRVLPGHLDFKIAGQDVDEDKSRADLDSKHIENAKGLVALGLPKTAALRKLVEQGVIDEEDLLVEETEESGDDTGAEPERVGGPQGPFASDATAENAPPPPPVRASNAPPPPDDADEDEDDEATANQGKAIKASDAFDRLQSAYFVTLQGLIRDAIARRPNRPRFTRQMQGEVTDHWLQAFMLGLQDGGVQVESVSDLEDEERQHLLAAIAEERGYVSNFVSSFFADLRAIPDGQPEARDALRNAYETRLLMWATSLKRIYNDGYGFATANEMVEWVLGATEEHCDSCLAASGQVHRRSAWRRAGIEPQSRNLTCGGWHCDCELVKTDKRATGRLSRIPLARKAYGQAAWQFARRKVE